MRLQVKDHTGKWHNFMTSTYLETVEGAIVQAGRYDMIPAPWSNGREFRVKVNGDEVFHSLYRG